MRRTSGAVVCPSCERLVSVTEPKCPYCGAWRPGMFGYGPAIHRLLGGRLDLSGAITVLCGALFVLSLLLDPGAIFHMAGLFNILSPSGLALLHLGMTGAYSMALGQWWTLCTAIFLHGSALHILFNMVIMRRYLPMVAELFGNTRAFVIFMAGGILGFVISNMVTGHNTIGASGAIFGLFGALISYGRRTGQQQVTQQLLMSAIVMFFLSMFMSTGVNSWAHAGGFAGGFLAAELMPTTHRRDGPGLLVLAGGLTLVTLGGFLLSFLGFTPAMIH